MLKIYLGSVIIWSIILIATNMFVKEIVKDKNIDYKKYIKNKNIKGKLSFIVIISFIPVIRLVVWGVMIWLIGADEQHLDKILNKPEKN